MIKQTLFYFLVLLFISTDAVCQGFDAEVIKYTTLCEVEKDKSVQTDSVTIQINNRAGDKFSKITIPYSKTNKVSDISAWIETMDGIKVRSLKNSEISDKSAISDISMYEDNYEKLFQLKHNTYPYKVVYTFKTTYRNFIAITYWSPILHRSVPTRTSTLHVSIPKGYEFNKFENNITQSSIDSTDSRLLLAWKASYVNLAKAEIFSQPEMHEPYVIIAPLNFDYGVKGSSKNWRSYGNWQYRLIQGLDILPDEEKKTISDLIKGVNDKKEIVKILYHYLQDHTRYIHVSIGIGGFKPYSAIYVSTNKYGDCKALSNYMKAMLSFAGIESFYTKVYASEQPRNLIKAFAGPQFNHIVLAVPLSNDTIWIENTSNINPFGYLGTFTQNREALLITEDNSRLVKIPTLKTEDILVFNKLEFDLNVSGNATVKLISSFKGSDFEKFNQLNSEYNRDEKDRIIREYMPFENYEVINWELKKFHRDTARIELISNVNLFKFLKPLGDEYYFSLYPGKIPSFSAPSNRILPVILPFPISSLDTLVYNLPVGYKMKTKVDRVSIETPYGKYEQSFNVTNVKIVVIKRFTLF